MSRLEDLTVREALALVLARFAVLPAEEVALLEALGRVSAAPVVAGDDLPPFANSAMDGYAPVSYTHLSTRLKRISSF